MAGAVHSPPKFRAPWPWPGAYAAYAFAIGALLRPPQCTAGDGKRLAKPVLPSPLRIEGLYMHLKPPANFPTRNPSLPPYSALHALDLEEIKSLI